MAVVIASATSSQAELDHAVSENWRTPPEAVEEKAPAEHPDEGAETAAAMETAEETESKAQPNRTQRRKLALEKLAKQKNDLEAQLNEVRRENEQLRARKEGQPEPQIAGEPKQEQYKSIEEYVKALVKYEREQSDLRDQQTALAEQRAGLVKEYKNREAVLKAEVDDYEEVAHSDLIVPQSVLNAIVEMGSEGPDVAYFLGSHPEVCEELCDMTALSAVRRLGVIATEISRKSKSQDSQEEPKTRNSPPPPVRSVSSSTRTAVPLDQLSGGDYVRIRNQQIAQKNGRRRF